MGVALGESLKNVWFCFLQ